MSDNPISVASRSSSGLLTRWTVLIAVVGVLTAYASCRLSRAARELREAGGLAATGVVEPVVEYWGCTMDPEIRAEGPGDCPKCGMPLVEKYVGSDELGVKPATVVSLPAPVAPDKPVYMCTMPACNDTPSDDPNSKCPNCGMKRERIDLGGGEDTGKYEVSLSERARRLAEVATEPVEYRALFKTIRTVGKVAYDETRHKMVTAWIEGRIDKLFADYTGMVVAKGDHLVELYSPDLVTAQEGLLAALRGYEDLKDGALPRARARSERLIRSAEVQLELLGVSRDQIDEVKKTQQAATHVIVHAPIGGTVVRKSAMEGMYVKTGDMLYEIADLTHVWLILELYESDLPWIRPFQDVAVTAESIPGETLAGKIAFVDPVVDRKTRTIRVRVNVPNPELRLKPEMFVNAEIHVLMSPDGRAAVPSPGGAFACSMHPWETADEPSTCEICEMAMVPVEAVPGYVAGGDAGPVLSVPREAVLQTGERALVFVEREPGIYRAAEVSVGPMARDAAGRVFYPLLAGLKEHDRIVTRGNFAIDSQLQLAGKPSLFGRSGGGGGGHGMHHGGAMAGGAGMQGSGDKKGGAGMGGGAGAQGGGGMTDGGDMQPGGAMTHEGMASGESAGSAAGATVATGNKDRPDDGKQKICPVMGNPIDLKVYTDFRGVRVYFCCAACIGPFTEDLPKYLPKLPAAMQAKIKAYDAGAEGGVDG